jgi:signal recognition particle receptor subunit beta
MVSLNTETDRTLFFDLLPMDVGVVGGFKTKLQLYTVPGQVFYNSTRKLVLKGVDGIVFVADSQVPMLDANKESLQNLEANLKELGMHLRDIPMVFQWNKRDLKNIVSVEDLERELNAARHLSFQSNAQEGTGVFETLRGITKLALTHIKTHHLGETNPAREEHLTPQDDPHPAPSLPSQVPTGVAPATMLPNPVKPMSARELPSTSDLSAGSPGNLAQPLIRKMPVLPRPPSPASPVPTPRPFMAPMGATMMRSNPSPRPAVSPMMVSLAAPSAPMKAKSPTPRAAVSALLGDLTNVSLAATSSVLRLELPPEFEGTDLEVFVEIRQGGRKVVQGEMKRTAPLAGVTSRLTLELKRS